MTPAERARLRELCEKATPGPWAYRMGDIVQLTDAGKGYPLDYYPDSEEVVGVDQDGSRILADANAEYIAAANPTVVLALLDEVERLQANRDHSCTCPHGDASEPLRNHDRVCPIRVNKLKRIAPEVAMKRIAAALDSGDEVDELRTQLAAMTSARGELADAAEHIDPGYGPIGSHGRRMERIAELRKVGTP